MERLVRDALNVPVEPGNDLPPPSVVCVRGFARQPPRSPTGHPRNKQNGSEERPRSSYHAGRGHQVQGGRRPIMKIPFRVLVWPNLLIEARAAHLGQLSPRSWCLCRRSGRGNRGSAAWLSSPFALRL